MSKNLAVIALYDRVSKSYSYPMVVEPNMPLLKREIRNQVQSAKSYELSVNYPDKCVVYVGDYDLETGIIEPKRVDLVSCLFGDINILRDRDLDRFILFELKDLFFDEKEVPKSE